MYGSNWYCSVDYRVIKLTNKYLYRNKIEKSSFKLSKTLLAIKQIKTKQFQS